MKYQPPFPWFGGKSRIAHEVWSRFGQVDNYVEPFFGSGAVLMLRPSVRGIETVNDLDGMVSNFWRAAKLAPDQVAQWADWPVNENDLHARHVWLRDRKESLQAKLEGDPDYFDAKIAGWWAWGQCCWIGSGWCGSAGDGPWSVQEIDGVRQFVKTGAAQGVNRQRVHLGDAGQGVNRQRVHLGDAGQDLIGYFAELSARLRRVRVCCGDWSRVCGPAVTVRQGVTAVFLDPPYSAEASRDDELYSKESLTVAHDVREWALAQGDNPLMRIALCGYEGEHEMPSSWDCWAWKANGGMANQGNNQGRENTKRERVWFSPHCLSAMPLFSEMGSSVV
jgi:site-specific DNA-adenine methylase